MGQRLSNKDMNIVGFIGSIENMSRIHTYNVKLKGKLNKEDNTM